MPLISSAGGHSLDLQLGADRSIGDGSDPACDRRSPTTREWTAGSPFAERAILAIAADAPPGRHPILVGISQPAAGHRLRPATTLPTRAGLVELDYVEVGAER